VTYWIRPSSQYLTKGNISGGFLEKLLQFVGKCLRQELQGYRIIYLSRFSICLEAILSYKFRLM